MNIARVAFCLSALYAASLCCMAANLVPGGDFTEAKKGKIGWCRTEEGKFSLHNETIRGTTAESLRSAGQGPTTMS